MTAKVPKMAPKGVPNGAPNPPKMAPSWLRDLSPWPLSFRVPFRTLFGQGLSAQNVALAISKPHFGFSKKSHFLAPFWLHIGVRLGPILVLFGFPGPFQNKVQKMPSKKTAPKPKMSQNGLPKSVPVIDAKGVP